MNRTDPKFRVSPPQTQKNAFGKSARPKSVHNINSSPSLVALQPTLLGSDELQATAEIHQTPWAEFVRVVPPLLLDAVRHKLGGGIRAWLFARTLDTDGSGGVDSDDLNGYLEYLGVQDRTTQRWIASAVISGLLTPYFRTRSGKSGYRYVSLDQAAVIAGCHNLGRRVAQVAAKNLVKAGWRSFAWGAFIVTLNERPVSRDKKHKLTGVPRSTQIHLETHIEVHRTPNYVISDIPTSHLDGIREFGRPYAFAFRKPNGERVVAWRGPDACAVSDEVAINLSKGRLKKANKRLSIVSCAIWSTVGPALSNVDTEPEYPGRLFYTNTRDAKNFLKHITRPTAPSTDIREVFVSIPSKQLFPKGKHFKACFWKPEAV